MNIIQIKRINTNKIYVGLPDDEDDFDFTKRFTALKAELEGQIKEELNLNEIIKNNLAKIQTK